MSQHLSEAMLNSFVDEELSPAEATEVAAHLAECGACTTSALSRMMLKSAVARAGRRYELPAQMHARLPMDDAVSIVRTRPAPIAWIAWTAGLAAVFILAAGMGFFERRATEKAAEVALVAEITDQHVSSMAVGAPPEVLSSDRHTVKPWFQGKLPFSFNLPDNLPAGTTLDGANLTYIHGRPTAQLLYSIGKHRVSVYLQQRSEDVSASRLSTDRSGFHVISFNTGDINGIAVSDVEPARLADLVSIVEHAQK